KQVGRAAKIYIFGVIGTGALVLAWTLANGITAADWSWTIYAALAVLASMIQFSLPGMDGTYSPSILFLLYGLAPFPLSSTLLAAGAGAVAQCLPNGKKREGLIPMLFTTANAAISVGACFLIGRIWLAEGMAQHLPAVMALVACAYFVINTILVSGVLALLN